MSLIPSPILHVFCAIEQIFALLIVNSSCFLRAKPSPLCRPSSLGEFTHAVQPVVSVNPLASPFRGLFACCKGSRIVRALWTKRAGDIATAGFRFFLVSFIFGRNTGLLDGRALSDPVAQFSSRYRCSCSSAVSNVRKRENSLSPPTLGTLPPSEAMILSTRLCPISWFNSQLARSIPP